jgi:hypothetical protein
MSKKIMYASEKRDGTYSTPVPFGVFGENVKMADSNNLEEELKLGGSCKTSLEESEDGNTVVITAKYDDESTLVTTIVEKDDTTVITQELLDSTSNVIKTKTITFEGDAINEEVTSE